MMKRIRKFWDGQIVSENFWIPFESNGIEDFSHEEFTTLKFKETPGKARLLREFKKILHDDSADRFKLIDSLAAKLDGGRKLIFYTNIKKELKVTIEDFKHRIFNLSIDPKTDSTRVIAHAKATIDFIDDKMNDFQNNLRPKNTKSESEKESIGNLKTLNSKLFVKWNKNPVTGEDDFKKDFIAWAMMPIDTERATLEHKKKEAYLEALSEIVGFKLSEQFESNVTASQKKGSYTKIAEDFIEKWGPKKK